MGADLRKAKLYGSQLRGANLYHANLEGCDLKHANINGTTIGHPLKNWKELNWLFARTRILPEGDIFGYKKCANNIIVKLLIRKEHKRSHSLGRKCRAEEATVVEIFGARTAYSVHDPTFSYEVGQIVKPKQEFNEDWREECTSGIHFFITREEAENYDFS
jgi:hypothetical protein